MENLYFMHVQPRYYSYFLIYQLFFFQSLSMSPKYTMAESQTIQIMTSYFVSGASESTLLLLSVLSQQQNGQ